MKALDKSTNMWYNTTMIKILKGLAPELLLNILQEWPYYYTARRGLFGWRGSLIVDAEKARPMVTTRKRYKTKDAAVYVLRKGVVDYVRSK